MPKCPPTDPPYKHKAPTSNHRQSTIYQHTAHEPAPNCTRTSSLSATEWSPKPLTISPPMISPTGVPEGPTKRLSKSPFFPSLVTSCQLGWRFLALELASTVSRTRAFGTASWRPGLGSAEISFSECLPLTSSCYLPGKSPVSQQVCALDTVKMGTSL